MKNVRRNRPYQAATTFFLATLFILPLIFIVPAQAATIQSIVDEMMVFEAVVDESRNELNSIKVTFKPALVLGYRKNGVLTNPDDFSRIAGRMANNLWLKCHNRFQTYRKTAPINLVWGEFNRDTPENLIPIKTGMLVELTKMKVYGHPVTDKLTGKDSPYLWLAAQLKYDLVRQLMIQAEFAASQDKEKSRKIAEKHLTKMLKAAESNKIYVSDYTLGCAHLYDYVITGNQKSADTASRYITSHLYDQDAGKYKGILKNGDKIDTAAQKIMPDVYYEMAKILGYGYLGRDAQPFMQKAYEEEKARREGENKGKPMFDNMKFTVAAALSEGLKARKSAKLHAKTKLGKDYSEFVIEKIRTTRDDYMYLPKIKKYRHSQARTKTRSLFEYMEKYILGLFQADHIRFIFTLDIQADDYEDRMQCYQKN